MKPDLQWLFLISCAGCMFAGTVTGAELGGPYRFNFGTTPLKDGFTKVTPDALWSSQSGFGFEAGSKPAQLEQGITGDRPVYFSVAVPEGNYRVTARLGDTRASCTTTIKAESRRLMVKAKETAAGKFETVTFIVNVRNSKVPAPPLNAPGGDKVRLNDREAGVLHWDDKLTLEFNDRRPCVATLEIVKADDVPTIFLAGDSTVTDQPREPTTSWGQMLPLFLKPEIAVANHAESGETLKSFLTGLRLDKILSQIRKGDYILMQFGHNDMKENWPQTYVEPFTTHAQYLKVFIAEARRRGAIPVLVTPMQRRDFAGSKIRNTLADFPASVRETAKQENVPLIDLTPMSVAFYEALGPERSVMAFSSARDITHHSSYGAWELAKCVVEGIRAAKLDLARFISADYQPFDPAKPDSPEAYSVPPSQGIAGQFARSR